MDDLNSLLSPDELGMVLFVLGLLAVSSFALAWWLRQRRRARSLPERLRRGARDLLSGVLISDGEAGQIHIEYALLTRSGVLVVDVRDVAGHVFGSESMQDWTVLSGGKRSTFPNPLPPLYDRVAAVNRLLPDTPVTGQVLFTARAQFTTALPADVTTVDHFLAELERTADAPAATAASPALDAAWARLREAARSTRA